MLMVVFGAGASFDSVHFRPVTEFTTYSYPWRPPLANQLFDDRSYFNDAIDRFPPVESLAQRLRRLPNGTSLENQLDSLWADAPNYLPLRKQFAALRFYLQQVLWACGNNWHTEAHGVTNYVGL